MAYAEDSRNAYFVLPWERGRIRVFIDRHWTNNKIYIQTGLPLGLIAAEREVYKTEKRKTKH
jgi:hypothetical protein